MRANRIISVIVVLAGLFLSACFQNDGWTDEPITPEKDSLVVEETEANQEFREQSRIDITIASTAEESTTRLFFSRRSFSVRLVSKFNCYIQKVRSEDPPEDLRIVFASFIV